MSVSAAEVGLFQREYRFALTLSGAPDENINAQSPNVHDLLPLYGMDLEHAILLAYSTRLPAYKAVRTGAQVSHLAALTGPPCSAVGTGAFPMNVDRVGCVLVL